MHHAIRFHDRLLNGLSRRQLLNLAWKLGAAAVLQPVASSTAWAQPAFRLYPFPLGVASGEPWPDSVVLWTRLAPEPLDGGGVPMARVDVGWEVASDATFRTIVQKGTTTAWPELGHSVHVEAPGLAPGRDYWYRFHCGGEVSAVGRTKTAPASGAAVDRLRFGVCGCGHYEQGYFTAYGHLAEEAFDFVVHTGDYIYEDRDHGGRSPGRVRRHHQHEIFTVVDYRNRYAQYKLDPDLQAAHHSAPFLVTWDDHEVDNDYAGDHDEHDAPPELFLLRRAAAYQAYFEAMPQRASAMPRGPDMRLYRRLQFGNLIDVSMLDTRQYRSPQACGGGAKTNCVDALSAARAILGAEQERWLFDNLASARSRWTLLGQQVPTFERDWAAADPDGRFSMDKWDGYTASRQRLYQRLKDTKAPNPILLSGDVHLHYGADLKLDFTKPGSEAVGVEFTNSSITSGGDGTPVTAAWEKMRGDNPHITYHSGKRGYISCTATAAEMRADFRIVDQVTTPHSPVTTAGAVVVAAGKPGSVRA